jgi:hypothetical protein
LVKIFNKLKKDYIIKVAQNKRSSSPIHVSQGMTILTLTICNHLYYQVRQALTLWLCSVSEERHATEERECF